MLCLCSAANIRNVLIEQAVADQCVMIKIFCSKRTDGRCKAERTRTSRLAERTARGSAARIDADRHRR